jgi:hypothetical protein
MFISVKSSVLLIGSSKFDLCSIVATLCEELDNLRRSICHNCKRPAYAAGSGPSSSFPLVLSPVTGEFRDEYIPENQAKPALPQSIINASPNRSTIPIHSLSLNQGLPLVPLRLLPLLPITPVEIKSKQLAWSISHNPKINQGLHIDLVKTFDCIATVNCVEFSPGSKYLAVGLVSESIIYDVETGLKIWLVPS